MLDKLVAFSLAVVVASLCQMACALGTGGSVLEVHEPCHTILPSPTHYRLVNRTVHSPFYLIQSSNVYHENGKPILVEIGGASFKGFILVALDPLTGKRIGSWDRAPGIHVLPCSAAIHADLLWKKHAFLVWRSPANQNGYVAFEMTIMDKANRLISGQVSILPHQFFTHIQENAMYEHIESRPLAESIQPYAPIVNGLSYVDYPLLDPSSFFHDNDPNNNNVHSMAVYT